MSRRSRGCLRCRQRRVKCDQGRPSCMRCITRNELCVGYREESDLIFQNETDKILQRNKISEPTPTPTSGRSRSRSLSRLGTSSPSASPASITSWQTDITLPEEEDPTVSKFMDNYVIYPCTESSNAGFLEHLPSLFKEVNVEGRFALRYAVQAAAYGDVSRQRQSSEDAKTAMEYYGHALAALSKSLAEKGKVPDDYDLMTVVLLDIFETVFLPDDLNSGSHAQGMANILRLRSHQQFHDPRGWSLFRLAHHRLQKQQLAKGLSPMVESPEWLTSLSADDSFCHLERDGLSINNLCHMARQTLSEIQNGIVSNQEIIPLVNKMIELDSEATNWRKTPQWSFKTIDRELVLGNEGLAALLPPTIELHRDIWMIYEWNYNRAARITLHHQLLACIEAISDELVSSQLQGQHEASVAVVQRLANEVLATVPQSFGDVDASGNLAIYHELFGSQAVGGYFLLWPIKIIKGEKSYSSERQKEAAEAVFERIRDCTGMKTYLGSLSII